MRSILLEEMGCNNGVGIIEQDVNGNNNKGEKMSIVCLNNQGNSISFNHNSHQITSRHPLWELQFLKQYLL